MSDLQALENYISTLSADQQYLVQDCAYQVQQVLDRYQDPLIQACGVNLVAVKQLESIKY
ncbi:hypothetical protein [Hymenobacter baengnokdamensis]|uniref:hypothetical protein n=1 Tax=Hymenobacter baengnokdamensis TaxID=2615203 RepID=UPI0012489AD6|nr:hypothetical protein [Hymenobacter baengnokdamensis]